MQSRKDKINSKDITERFLFNLFVTNKILSQIVERVQNYSVFNRF